MAIILTPQQRAEKLFARLKIDDNCPACKAEKLRKILPFGRDGPHDEGYILTYMSKL